MVLNNLYSVGIVYIMLMLIWFERGSLTLVHVCKWYKELVSMKLLTLVKILVSNLQKDIIKMCVYVYVFYVLYG